MTMLQFVIQPAVLFRHVYVYARVHVLRTLLRDSLSWRTINSVALTFSVTPRTCENKDKADDESSQRTENPRSYLFSLLSACHSSCCCATPRRNEKHIRNAENNRESRGNYERGIFILPTDVTKMFYIKYIYIRFILQ